MYFKNKLVNLNFIPIKYCTGMSQDFRLPNFFTYNASTNGANKNFTLNGQLDKLNTA